MQENYKRFCYKKVKFLRKKTDMAGTGEIKYSELIKTSRNSEDERKCVILMAKR